MAGCAGPLGRAHMQPVQQQAERLHINPDLICGSTAQAPSAVSGTVLLVACRPPPYGVLKHPRRHRTTTHDLHSENTEINTLQH